jgi:hypothetical protein
VKTVGRRSSLALIVNALYDLMSRRGAVKITCKSDIADKEVMASVGFVPSSSKSDSN